MDDLNSQATETPATDFSPEAANEQQAERFLEGALARAGVQDVGEPAPAPDRAPQTTSSLESREAAAPPVEEKQRVLPHMHPASLKFFDRINGRAERLVMERIARAAEILERNGAQPAVAAQQAAVAQDPEPRVDPDYPETMQAWYAWRRRQDQRDIEERLAPVTEFITQQRETQAQQQERLAYERQEAEFNRAMADELNYAVQAYSQVPEGKDFNLRFQWYVNDVMAEGLRRVGFEPRRAQEFARINMMALTNLALQNRINPALFIDQIIAAGVESTIALLTEAGYQPPAAGQPAPQRRNGNGAMSHQQQEIRTLRETAAGARSVSSGPRTAGASPKGGASGISAVLQDPSPDNIRAWANEEFGGDTSKALRVLRRAERAAQVNA